MDTFKKLSIITVVCGALSACHDRDNIPAPEPSANQAPVASSVSIADDNGGDAVIGDSLTGSYSYSDADNDTEGASTFRWLRDGTAISDATGESYTLTTTDAETDIVFEVTPVAATGTMNGDPVNSATISVNPIPVNEVPVASSLNIVDDNGGSTVVGDGLTASYTYNDAENDPEGVSTYQWLRDGSAIDGATSLIYSVTTDDVDTAIGFEVTPIASSGTLAGSPVQSSTISVTNTAPVATNVTIIDLSGADAIVGEELQGSYTYSDVENDLEGTSTFKWFKDAVVITEATANTYMLILDDVGAQISFEVTPVATSGTLTGVAVTSDSVLANMSPPVVTNLARFMDTNQSGVMDAGDVVVIPFDQSITVNSAGIDDLTLAVTDDQFGAGATVSAGPRANELTVTLGTLPKLTVEGDFDESSTSSGDPSGVDVSGSLAADIIENSTGIDAVTSSPIDFTPGFVLDAYYSGGDNNWARRLAIGDLNGDGRPDVVFGMAANNYAEIMLNNGDGSFSLNNTDGPFGARSNDIALGDMDGDGDLDIVIAGGHIQNGFSPRSVVFTNDENGVFTELQSLGSNGSSVAIGDVNGDGDLDIALGSNVNSAGAFIYINDINDDGNVGVFTSTAVAYADNNG